MRVFGRYTLQRLLGRGGMGVVWLAQDAELDLRVALKFLPDDLAHDEEAISDLRRETRKSIQLTHSNIVRVYDFVKDENLAAVSMEYVDGSTLQSLKLKQPGGCFSAEDLRPWLAQICKALSHAHEECRIVHRDLKPANVMLTAGGAIKVMDFGIARSLSETLSRSSRPEGGAFNGGTLAYMSPQQLMGFPASVTDDVYSLGAMLYELLTGKPPFYTGSIERQIETITPPPVAQRREELGATGMPPVPENWERCLFACMEKAATARPPSVAEVWTRLNTEAGPPVLMAIPVSTPTPAAIAIPVLRTPKASPPVAALAFESGGSEDTTRPDAAGPHTDGLPAQAEGLNKDELELLSFGFLAALGVLLLVSAGYFFLVAGLDGTMASAALVPEGIIAFIFWNGLNGLVLKRIKLNETKVLRDSKAFGFGLFLIAFSLLLVFAWAKWWLPFLTTKP